MTKSISKSILQSLSLLFLATLCCSVSCKKTTDSTGGGTGGGGTPVTPPAVVNEVNFWMTTPSQSSLLAKQNVTLAFGTTANSNPTIIVDSTQPFQSMDGFGYTLTGGSAQLIFAMSTDKRAALLREIFSRDSGALGVSYIRISIGASDLSSTVFTYDDMPAGQTDPTLQNFSLDKERLQFLPVLKQILAINPSIKILGSPWSAPVWMKTNNSSAGGSLNPLYYGAYADYLVKYIQGMKAEGVTIDAITPQNEPLNPNNNPSMVMQATEELDFIKNNLGPKFRAAALTTKIITYDHNADRTDYPLTILADPTAYSFIDGSAFHLYGGNISALTPVHDAYPNKNLYFTEIYTGSGGTFNGDLNWHLTNIVIGAPRNWCKNVLEWNLAIDPNLGPHTTGGCTTCLGAITINGDIVTRNVGYYIIGHASRFVPPGSLRVASNVPGSLQNVAYTTPEGKKVLIVFNGGSTVQTFNIQFKNKWVTASLDAGSAGTFVW